MKKLAFIHALPLDRYPPSRAMVEILGVHSGWQTKVWTTSSGIDQGRWRPENAEMVHFRAERPGDPLPVRMLRRASWRLRMAIDIARWRPDALMYVEPHSAPAAWLYYRLFNSEVPLLIHHHELYLPDDFDSAGMRSLRSWGKRERTDLFSRATWISETNSDRLRLLEPSAPRARKESLHVLPNYPSNRWLDRIAGRETQRNGRLRLVYLGAASFETTFIKELVDWVTRRDDVILEVFSDNIAEDVVRLLESSPQDKVNYRGALPHDDLPAVLPTFDVGIVLYNGHSRNFVYNVPNKAIEYLAAGLAVWYPTAMLSLRRFHREHQEAALVELDFLALPEELPLSRGQPLSERSRFSAEDALRPLLDTLDRL